MSVQKLETLTNNPGLLLRAKLALKAVHQWNTDLKFNYYPSLVESASMSQNN